MSRLSKRSFFPAAALVLACGLLPAAAPGSGDLPARLQKPAPEGFSPGGPLQLYGTAENKRQDGSIFDYMDGAGVAYLEHGYREMLHAAYADGKGGEITLEVFTFGSADQARDALADERICPAGGTKPGFDPGARAHRFPPDYFIYFQAGVRLVYLHVNDDRLSETLDRFAARVRLVVEKE